ncbi:MAG: hypothetical protein M1820_000356 [Bogoriella megaspora]|nr:MAG: hypothetical protein M1820_000356 [Bogoriella megaspora]
MSGYSGRRQANVSEYIRTLNQIPSAADLAAQQNQENFTTGLDEDLAPFMNTEFFDYDGELGNLSMPISYDAGQNRPNNATAKTNPNGYEFLNTDFQFNEFPDIPSVAPDGAATAAIHTAGTAFPQPSNQQQQQQFSSPVAPSASAASSPVDHQPHGTKRPMDSMSPPAALEEQSRLAAEEDKRRRNTAASARFRVKKKQREQQLEKTAKEMTEKVSALEARINQLEMENKWLKGLITEKNEAKDGVGELREKLKADKEAEKAERSLDTSKDGVGTVKAEKA